MKGLSLFASAGIAETYLRDIGIEITVANELLPVRANFYSHLYPESKMIQGDITKAEIKQKIESEITGDLEFLIATPPCQGFSTLGRNKKNESFSDDERNFLIFDVFHFIDKYDFKYIFIENVPRFFQMYYPFNGKLLNIIDILNIKYAKDYIIEHDILNAKDYGVPQSRPRAIIKMYKKELSWSWPIKEKEIPLKEAIGHLPSLESGEMSNIKYHNAKIHNERDIIAMKHTPTGMSAHKNEYYYPKRIDGNRISGFHNTYKRMDWDKPAPARTTNSGNIGSHNNVHPGKLLNDGTYSDSRVLTLRELLIVSSLPEDWNVPEWASDTLIRTVIGEAIPPILAMKILKEIK